MAEKKEQEYNKRKSYHAPELQHLGSVQTLTKGGTGVEAENLGGSFQCGCGGGSTDE